MINKIYILLFGFYFYCFLYGKLEKQLEPREGLEYYQLSLFNYLYHIINREELLKYTISDFTSQKSKTLNFFQAMGLLLFSLADIKNDKYTIWALERLYSLSSDAKLSEMLLWNLACEYEKYEKYRVSSELFYQFKKIFPGSAFYWTARYKEIATAYQYCQDQYHDIYDTEKTIKLAQDYITDSDEMHEKFNIEALYILQDLSLQMIKKTIDIGFHYLKKNKYTYDPVCILSSWQRLDQLLSDANYFLNFNIKTVENDKKYINYVATLSEMKKQIQPFFNTHVITLPSGGNYQQEHQEIIQYINKNKQAITTYLNNIYKKIDYCVEIYYEIK